MVVVIKWNLINTFSGSVTPHETHFNTSVFMNDDAWERLPKEAKKSLIEQAVVDDFDSKIRFKILDYGIGEVANGSYFVKCPNCSGYVHQRSAACEACGHAF